MKPAWALAVAGLFLVLSLGLILHPSPGPVYGSDKDEVAVVRGEVLDLETRHGLYGSNTIATLRVDEVVSGWQGVPTGEIEVRYAQYRPALDDGLFYLGETIMGDGNGNAVDAWLLQDVKQGCCWESRTTSLPGILMWPVAGLLFGGLSYLFLKERRPAWWDLAPAAVGILVATLVFGVYHADLAGDWTLDSDGEGNMDASPLVLSLFIVALVAGASLAFVPRPHVGFVAGLTGAIMLLLYHVMWGTTYSDEMGRRMGYLLILPAALAVPMLVHRFGGRHRRWMAWSAFGLAVGWIVLAVAYAMRFEIGGPSRLVTITYFGITMILPIVWVAVEAAQTARPSMDS